MIILSLVAGFISQGAKLGVIDFQTDEFSILRKGAKAAQPYRTITPLGIPIWPGDAIIVSKKGAIVMGNYDACLLKLKGPRNWVAPEKGVWSRTANPSPDRLLGRTDLGGPKKSSSAEFIPFIPKSTSRSEVYVDGEGALRLAWTVRPNVGWTEVSATVGNVTLSPARHAAHVKNSPDPSIGWMEDKTLGTQLLQRFARESEDVEVTIRFHQNVGPDVMRKGMLLSKSRSRDLDPLVSALVQSLQSGAIRKTSEWYEDWCALLLATQADCSSTNAFWTVRLWSLKPSECSTVDAMKDLRERG